jgi:hypothetical protein
MDCDEELKKITGQIVQFVKRYGNMQYVPYSTYTTINNKEKYYANAFI